MGKRGRATRRDAAGRARREAERRRQDARLLRRRAWRYALVAGAVLLVAGALFAWPFLRPRAVAGEGLQVRINMGGFTPRVITARAGEPLTITLINEDNQYHTDGGGWHNFIVEALGVDERVAPLKARTFTFTPRVPGEYGFYCDICCGGKENPMMQGLLVVEG